MADYNANIKVNADTRQAESQLKKLESSLDKLSNFSANINLKSAQQQFKDIGTSLKGIGERGALGGIALASGKATAAIGGLGAKFGVLGAAAASAGAAVNTALGGVPGIITDILSQVGNIPNAFGLAAVAALAFAPQLLKASSAATALGAAVDKAVGKQTTEKIAGVADSIGQLNFKLEAAEASFKSLLSGSTLNQLNAQLKDAVFQTGEFQSSTQDAVTAAEQLVAVQKEQRKEQKAITDLIRQAQGLQPQDVRDTEVARRVSLLKSREVQQEKDLKIQNQINVELAEYERLATQVANETKQWANNLDRIARSSKAGVLGSRSQIQSRIQEFRENQRSVEIARERSAQLLGGQYSLQQLPAGKELLPGGRTETASPQFRSLLNEQARIRQTAATALERSEKTLIGLQAQTLRTEKDITAAKREQKAIDERSVEIIREQNALLLKQISLERRKPVAALTPTQRVSSGVLDPESLRADRLRRVEQGRDLQNRRKESLSNAVIGGAFPLLFGQGPGAALGGGLGGAAGGFAGGQFGFGLSLIGTAVGQAVDTLITKTTELGGALLSVSSTFDTLKERSLISTREREKELQVIQDAGAFATANAAAQEELYKIIGVSGVSSLRELGSETDRLNRTWAELSVQLQAVVAGPLADLASKLNEFFKPIAQAGRAENLRQDLSPTNQRRFDQELGRLSAKGTYQPSGQLNRPQLEALAQFKPEEFQAALDKFGKVRVNADIKFDFKQVREEALQGLQKSLEALDISKSLSQQINTAAREQQDLDKQRTDLVRTYEENIGALRDRIEREIESKRFAALEKENQTLNTQSQIRIRELQLANQTSIAGAGVGLRPELEQTAKEVESLVASFTEKQLSAEQEAARIKRDAALEVQKIDSNAAQLKAGIEKEISRLNIETARRVADINEQVRRRNQDFDSNRFNLEKRIAQIQLKNNEILASQQLEAAKSNLVAAQNAGDAQGAAYSKTFVDIYSQQLAIVKQGQQDIANLSAPRPLRGVGAVGGGGVSAAGLDAATAQYRAAVENYVAAELRLNELDVVQSAQEFAQGITNIANKADSLLISIQTKQNDAEQERLRYIQLVNAGLTDTVAQKVIELETNKSIAVAIFDTAIAQLDSKIIAGEVTEQVSKQNAEYRKQIKILQDRKAALAGQFGGFNADTGVATGEVQQAIAAEPGKQIQDFIAKTRAELNDLEAVAIRVSIGIGDAVANSITSGLVGLVEGTTSAKQVFADFLKSFGTILIQESQKIIAAYIAIGIARIFAGFAGASTSAGGPNPGGIPSTGNVTAPSVNGFDVGSIANVAAEGAYWSGGFKAFADGGLVTAPTLGLIGEGGEPEYIIPASKMRGAMGRYASGSRGASVLPNSGEQGGPDTGSTAATTQPIDVRYSIERINSVDYVTNDQFQRGLAQAAQQGAVQGERRALRTLSNSPANRRRIGLG